MEPAAGLITVVLVTFPSMEVARSVSASLVEEGLAACVNLLPGAESVYRWEGKLEVTPEVAGLVKAPKAKLSELERRLALLHPYEVPEFLVLDVAAAGSSYLRWVLQS
jgi:periplasmic divalent cation tolerance protein